MSSDAPKGQIVLTSRLFTSESPDTVKWIVKKLGGDLAAMLEMFDDGPSYLKPSSMQFYEGIVVLPHDARFADSKESLGSEDVARDLNRVCLFVGINPVLYKAYYMDESENVHSQADLKEALSGNSLDVLSRVHEVNRSFVQRMGYKPN